jgi:thiosulfate dehydrogenase
MARRALLLASAATVAGCTVSDRLPEASRQPASAEVIAHRVPSDSEVTDPAILTSLRRGRALLRNTRDSLPSHVGNRLQCVSCHAMDGTKRGAMSLIGVYSRFPQYRARSGRIDLIEDRINDCFERSMHGTPIDRAGRDMRDMITYMAFLSRGVPPGARVDGQGVAMIDPPLRGDTASGRLLFATTCSACHGSNGEGTPAAPPVWGPHSYNIGAGMARVNTAAAFIRAAMPQTAPGTLTPQQAFDLAAYINAQPRPDFARKSLDWPNGDPPPDVAYPVRAKKSD